MFKREVKSLGELVARAMRSQGLATPLLQKRLVESWPDVVGSVISRYTINIYIRNQTLFVHLSSPALRADLSMRRKELVDRLNAAVGSRVIVDIKFS